jgi:hypothetical protein
LILLVCTEIILAHVKELAVGNVVMVEIACMHTDCQLPGSLIFKVLEFDPEMGWHHICTRVKSSVQHLEYKEMLPGSRHS